ITWTSDRDGMLGTGASVVVSSLSSGPHVLTAQVTDASGAIGQASVTISVAYAPQVAITAPANGSIFFVDQFPLTFRGTAFDQEDGDLTTAMQWSSSRDGALASG